MLHEGRASPPGASPSPGRPPEGAGQARAGRASASAHRLLEDGLGTLSKSPKAIRGPSSSDRTLPFCTRENVTPGAVSEQMPP